MRNRVVLYSVAGILALTLIAASAFKSRQPAAADGVAVSAPAGSLRSQAISRHALAKLRPAAKPAVTADADVPGTLPRSFRILLTHSLFCPQPAGQLNQTAAPADGQLTLRGVMQDGHRFAAYIENTASGQAQELHVGDAVGCGKLVAIDLDSVRYSTPARDMRVEVGQSFSGARAVATAQTSALATIRQINE